MRSTGLMLARMGNLLRGPAGKQMLAWLGMPFLAIANGVLRDTTYGRTMSDDASHGLSTAPLLALIAVYTNLVARRWPLRSRAQAYLVGAVGALFAASFDLVFGRIEGKSWGELFRDYNLFTGRLWALVPLALFFAPEVNRRWQRRHAGDRPDAFDDQEAA